MNDIPKPWQIEMYKKDYPPGTRIQLTADMEGEHHRAGATGSVIVVDDIGSIHTAWDDGGSLAVIPGVDSFQKIGDAPVKSAPAKKKNHDRSR